MSVVELNPNERFKPEGNETAEVYASILTWDVEYTPPSVPRNRIYNQTYGLIIRLDHQCDEWAAGDVAETKVVIEELTRCVRAIEKGDVVLAAGLRT